MPTDTNSLSRVNGSESPFFSVGCEKSFNFDPACGHWGRGYVEFSFNGQLVRDAQHYLKLFFEFSRQLGQAADAATYFVWELDGAEFAASGDKGFTVSVWLQTDDQPSVEAAQGEWAAGLDLLTDFLKRFPVAPFPKIYT